MSIRILRSSWFFLCSCDFGNLSIRILRSSWLFLFSCDFGNLSIRSLRSSVAVSSWSPTYSQTLTRLNRRDASLSGPIYTIRWRPYRCEYTGSLQNSEVNRSRARIVLRWGTAREVLRVLPALLFREVRCGGGPGTLWLRPTFSQEWFWARADFLPCFCGRAREARASLGTVAILAQGTNSWLATRSPFLLVAFGAFLTLYFSVLPLVSAIQDLHHVYISRGTELVVPIQLVGRCHYLTDRKVVLGIWPGRKSRNGGTFTTEPEFSCLAKLLQAVLVWGWCKLGRTQPLASGRRSDVGHLRGWSLESNGGDVESVVIQL